jgi:hypothetical protein
MGAQWAKNEVTPAKRRCDLIVYADSGAPAGRGVDFISLGMVYISAQGSPAVIDFALATGTLTNKRRPLSFTAFTFTAATTDICTKVAHGLETGDGPVRLTTTTTLPAGLALLTDYWFIKIDADTFYLATSLANAYAGTRVDITSTGTGTHTLSPSTSKRGIDGLFTYEATQAETAVDTSEIALIVEGSGYARANGGGTYTTVQMGTTIKGFDDIGEGSNTYGDLMRGAISILAAKVSGFNTGTIVFRNLADTKNRWTFTVDATGRLTSVANDLT